MTYGISFKRFTNIPLIQFLAAFTGAFSAINSGLHYGWTSPSLPRLLSNESHILLTQEDASWITTALPCGLVCGSVLTSIILDSLGRKAVILISTPPFFISWLLIAFSNETYLLIVARFIAGIGDGLIQCGLPVYVGEISDPNIRGLLGSAVSVFFFAGMLLVNVVGSFVSVKTAALILSSGPVLLFLLFVWMPDSPYYLVKKQKLDDAKVCLKRLSGKKQVDAQIEKIQEFIATQNTSGSGFSDILTSDINRRAFFLMLVMRTIQQMCGVYAITFYAQTIIIKSSGNGFSPEIGSTIYFGMYVVFLGICSALVDKIGRKPLLMFSITGSGVAILIQSLYLVLKVTILPWIPAVTIFAYAIFFSLGMQSIPMLLQGEMFPLNIKAKAVSIYMAYFGIVTALVFKMFQFTSERFGLHVPLFIFAGSSLIGLIFIIFFLPETKGKSLEEIQDELKGSKRKRDKTHTREKS